MISGGFQLSLYRVVESFLKLNGKEFFKTERTVSQFFYRIGSNIVC